MTKPLRVIIADDHPIVRDGFQTILQLQEEIEVVGTAADGETVVKLAETKQPDVILMDLYMPKMNGIDATKQIRKCVPHVSILMMTSEPDDDRIMQALVEGASGFLLKDWDTEDIIQAIHAIKKGQSILPVHISTKLASILHTQQNNPTEEEISLTAEQFPWGPWQEKFSEREKQILILMLEGRTNALMAELLHLSLGTVKNYISSIYKSLGVSDRAEAIKIMQDLQDEQQ